MEDWIEAARQNEEIQVRLDQVDRFLLAHHGLKYLLLHLCRHIREIYRLEAVTLALSDEKQRLKNAIALGKLEIPKEIFFRQRKEIRIILADLERPFLCNQVLGDIKECFFPGGPSIASIAVLPLWVRGEFMGTLNLGAASPRRYRPHLETHFLERLALKLGGGIDSALLLEQSKQMERSRAAVEMAGAACHELAQPLCTMELIVEKLKRFSVGDGRVQKELGSLEAELERVGELVKRISNVSQYVTKPYAKGLNIIDVAAAGPEDAPWTDCGEE